MSNKVAWLWLNCWWFIIGKNGELMISMHLPCIWGRLPDIYGQEGWEWRWPSQTLPTSNSGRVLVVWLIARLDVGWHRRLVGWLIASLLVGWMLDRWLSECHWQSQAELFSLRPPRHLRWCSSAWPEGWREGREPVHSRRGVPVASEEKNHENRWWVKGVSQCSSDQFCCENDDLCES